MATLDVKSSGEQKLLTPRETPFNVPKGFEGVASANPFENYDYQKSWWDRLGNVFGWRTEEDRVREQMALESANYNAQIASTSREEQYNNELNSANRLREAGLNPDLTGLSDASQASEFTEPQSMPDVFPGQSFSEFAGSMVQVMTSIMGVAKDMKSLQSIGLDIENKKFGQVAQLFNASHDFLLNNFGDLINSEDLEKEIYDRVYRQFGRNSFSDRIATGALDTLDSAGFSMKYYQDLEKGSEAREKYFNDVMRSIYFERAGKNGRSFSPTNDSPLDKVFQPIADAIQDLLDSERDDKKVTHWNHEREQSYLNTNGAPEKSAEAALNGIEVDLQRNQTLNESNYGTLDANSMTAQANADTTTANHVSQSEKAQTELESVFTDMISALDKVRHEGGIAGGLSAIAMAMILMVRGQMIPNIGYSNRKNVDTSTGEVYHTSSFSIGN